MSAISTRILDAFLYKASQHTNILNIQPDHQKLLSMRCEHHCPGRSGGSGGPSLCRNRDDVVCTLRDGRKVRMCGKHQVLCPTHEAVYVETEDLRIRCKQECHGCKKAREAEYKKARNEMVKRALRGDKTTEDCNLDENVSPALAHESLVACFPNPLKKSKDARVKMSRRHSDEKKSATVSSEAPSPVESQQSSISQFENDKTKNGIHKTVKGDYWSEYSIDSQGDVIGDEPVDTNETQDDDDDGKSPISDCAGGDRLTAPQTSSSELTVEALLGCQHLLSLI